MTVPQPDWLDPTPWIAAAQRATPEAAAGALRATTPAEREFAVLISPAAAGQLEAMAQRAQALTRRHFGRTISLYTPLYLSNYCSGGCTYCGFASDRKAPRKRLSFEEVETECRAIKALGVDEILLLTGERTPEADLSYLLRCVKIAARSFHKVTVEVFPMPTDEYRALVDAGCTGLTLYQETYDPELYAKLHRWGPKQDYPARLDAPERALSAGFRFIGIGALLGLGDPLYDMIALYQHATHLQRRHWRAGVSVSFPRIQPEVGGFKPGVVVTDHQLVQFILAFRICLPTVPLVLSTREPAKLRDGMAGIGVNKMSVASKTTVGGYSEDDDASATEQFEVSDTRSTEAFCQSLRAHGLEPVFKNWDSVYRAETRDAQ
ncbi:MAG: 2-iminoacetate synthase ThiH [Lentisphaerae bacterium]|jgi:2-iminoacetate synthase|nr:2-iminoacetate synthase ThiH [Lentisphaerota bacterium]MBT4818603.1 2-iminoacetate synthase ThiH [Lentisphaerota bacterium]MBT5605699.1 2-iminoacetate synthase ThiH [Lentisphaerota bacterium]MBT7060511.1 2-iminoacetate synthase ThiH [Lentisphaerota bacterium]MBT7844418.1 2-iminoacetate synthase ThiH [Lentisphaerota bacterium]